MLKLRNQFIMPPVKLGYSDATGVFTDKHANFYAARTKHLAAAATEPLYMDKGLRELPTQLGIDNDDKIEGLSRFTAMVHQNGAQAIAHLNHPGRIANPLIPGNYHVSASDVQCENGGKQPRPLSVQEIQGVVELFANSAKRAQKAGFDIIELQFGHGYLVGQFISETTNKRTDQYGGSFENRTRIAFEILDAVKAVTNLPIIIRISGEEMIPGGYKLTDMIAFTKKLKHQGIDAVHVSAGSACSTPPWFFQHMFVPKGKTWEMAAKIKKEVDIQVIAVGQINDFADVEKITHQLGIDYVAVGRPLVADPDFVGKYLGEVQDLLRPCLACSDGCLGGVKSGKGLGCLVNPLVGQEQKANSKTAIAKQIAVVGGGLAGAEAALSLSAAGHLVTLFEKNDIGGQFNLAHLPPKKASLKRIADYYREALPQSNIKLEKREATPTDLKGRFDHIILATGSTPSIPPIAGLKEFMWAEVLLEHNLPQGKNVAVIGGGLIGVEVAHLLEKRGNKVQVIEMLDEIARGMEMLERKLTLQAFNETNDVNIFLKSKVTKIEGDKIYLEGDDFKTTLEGIDHIIMATGMKPYVPLANELEGETIHIIGDANQVAKAQDAIADGYFIAQKIN